MSRPWIEPVTSRSPERTLYQLSYRGRSIKICSLNHLATGATPHGCIYHLTSCNKQLISRSKLVTSNSKGARGRHNKTSGILILLTNLYSNCLEKMIDCSVCFSFCTIHVVFSTDRVLVRIRAVAGQRSSPELCFANKAIV